ncbi:hypothetical protein ACFL4K_02790, partial [Candidatus Neomarinimicrobiota bacterium]
IAYDYGLIATHYHDFSRPGFFEHTSIRLVYDLAQIDLQGWIPLTGQLTVLVNAETAESLHSLPGFRQQDKIAIKDMSDLSRPEGWGERHSRLNGVGESVIVSGGHPYSVDTHITGIFATDGNKGEIYQAALRDLLADFVNKIEDPARSLRVGLEEGLASMKLAVRATAAARAS